MLSPSPKLVDGRNGFHRADLRGFSQRSVFVLVVTRKKSERIRVGQAIITLVSAENGKARIGIEAPRDVNVVREELIDGGFGPRTATRRRGAGKSAADGVGVCES